MILTLCFIAVMFGLGCILAALAHFVKHRRAIPVWASTTDRNGNYGGKP